MARFRWSSAACTDVGKVREHNEDALLELTDRWLWTVADGMGGHAVGDVASQMVVDVLRDAHTPKSLDGFVDDVCARLQDVNQRLREEAAERGEILIGSTVVVLLAFGAQVACVWAGDSRIYRVRNGELEQLTRDHTQLEDFISRGLIDREQAENYQGPSAITRAVGAEDALVLDVELLDVQEGDLFLLCSDGLTNEVNEEEMQTELNSGSCEESCGKLLNTALENGGRDNISIVVIRAEEELDATILNPMGWKERFGPLLSKLKS